MKNIILVFLSFLSFQVYSQKEASRWYFGNNAGMDFMRTQNLTSANGLGQIAGVPTSINGPFKTNEGCFAISDSDGNFLFTSDGIKVYGKNLAVMPNGSGLLGDPSSVNSGIVIPIPGDRNRYYVVTLPELNNPQVGIRYSVVDMRLNGGLGDVEVDSKNTLLPYGTTSGLTVSDTYENATVVGHENGIDYWLVSMMKNKFLAWLITKDGFSEPIVSIGPSYNTGRQSSIKISPDGSKIAFVDHSTTGGYFTLGNFSTSTGKIANITTRTIGVYRLYGVEFSPSGQYIYLTVLNVSDAQNGLYITHVNDIDNVPYNRVEPLVANVQLGPDGRIYGISPSRTFMYYPNNTKDHSLWIILDPDNGGTQIARFDNFFLSTTVPTFGLPPFITSFFALKPIVGKSLVCLGNIAEYSIEILSIGSGTQQIDHLVWDFGDGTPTVLDTSISTSKTIYKQQHDYSSKGEYTITVTPYLANGLPDNTKVNSIKVTVSECKIVTNKMIRHDISPQ